MSTKVYLNMYKNTHTGSPKPGDFVYTSREAAEQAAASGEDTPFVTEYTHTKELEVRE